MEKRGASINADPSDLAQIPLSTSSAGLRGAPQGQSALQGFQFLGNSDRLETSTLVHSVDELVAAVNAESSPACIHSTMGGALSTLSLGIYALINRQVVKPGEVGIIKSSGKPRLLKPGIHYITNTNDSFEGTMSVSDPSVSVKDLFTKTVVWVRENEVGGCYTTSGVYVRLEHGIHVLDHQKFSEPEVVRLNQQTQTVLGPLTFLRVDQGCIGGAYDSLGRFARLETGKFVLHQKDFRDISVIKRFQLQPVQLGPLTVVTVRQGNHGVVFEEGKVVILEEGHYVLEASQIFSKFISMAQHVELLKPIRITTNDGIAMEVKGVITYQVVDARRAAVAVDNLRDAIHEQAEIVLSRVCRSYSREDLSPTSSSSDGETTTTTTVTSSGPAQDGGAPTVHNVHVTTVHDKVKHIYKEIHDQAMEFLVGISNRWGVEVMSVDIESFTIKDEKVLMNISTIALSRIEAQAAQARASVTVTSAEAESKAKRINVDARAYELKEIAVAERDGAREKADAQAYQTKENAKAKAFEIRSLAEAQAEAATTKAKADLECAQLKNQGAERMCQFAQQLEFADRIVAAQQGISQVKTIIVPDAVKNQTLLISEGDTPFGRMFGFTDQQPQQQQQRK